MSEEEIKNNPSLKNLREDAEQFRNFRKAWPILRPFARLLLTIRVIRDHYAEFRAREQ